LPTLLAYRRAIAAELGPLPVHTTSTAASDLVSFTCASLVSANVSGAQFHSAWVYLNASTGANLAAQRAVLKQGGYDPDAGSVTVARAFSTIVTASMGLEIHTVLPALTDEMGVRGIREILNEDVLPSMPPLDLIPVTGVTAQAAYDVTTTYSWLTDKSQILGIYFQETGDEYPKPTGNTWDWLYDASDPRLLLPGEPFTTGETFYLKVHRPAQTWIQQVGGSWTADTDGLQYDNDAALPLLAIVKAQALSVCYRMLGSRQGPDKYISYMREREAFWTAKAYALRWWDDQKGDEETGPQIRMVSYGRPYGASRSYG